MTLFNPFSRRQKIARGEVPDVYSYDTLPISLRTQVIHIWRETVGTPGYPNGVHIIFAWACQVLRKEWGVFCLIDDDPNSPQEELEQALMDTRMEVEHLIDIIEVVFLTIQNARDDLRRQGAIQASRSVEEAITELNERFHQHGIGFQFELGRMIRIDSTFVHSEAIKPLLRVLSDNDCSGVNDEFLKAHEHYRHKRYKECLNECLKAFESGMKVICARRGWATASNATAKTLIDTIFSNGLIASSMLSEFSSLRSLLEAGIPTIRNRNSGHGQGGQPVTVPASLALFGLNLTASTLLFLFQTENPNGQ